MAALDAKTTSPWMVGVKRPRAVEIVLMRETLRRELRGLTCPTVLFGAQLFMPQRRHFLVPSLLMFAMLLGCALFIWRALKTDQGYAQIKKMHFLSDAFQHTARTIGHISAVVCANEDLFGRLIFLFVGPCCGSRLTYSTPYNAYITIHVSIVICRFAGSVADEFPFLLSALACCHLLYETFVTRRRSEEGALEKTRGMVTLAEDISYSVLSCFCDAVARVSADLDILEDSPSLSTLLSRRASTGRSFLDLVNMSDREKYMDFIKSFSSSAGDKTSTLADADNADGLQLRSVDVYLDDVMNVPVEVHVFHARLETLDERPFYLMGIMERESYRFSRKKTTKTGRAGGRAKGPATRVDQTTLNFESGRLEPWRPAFDEKDAALLSDIDLLRHGASRGALSSLGGPIGLLGQRPKGSPRLSGRESPRAARALARRAARDAS